MSTLLSNSVGSNINISVHLPHLLSRVKVDANQLELALLNLAVNARDAMPGGGTISIDAFERDFQSHTADGLSPGVYVVLRVIDNGEGMDEATLARAMEPFFTTKSAGQGTGLGLSMVYGFAAQSGGQFRLHSTRGAGTIAELWLPRAEPDGS
jgi:signal transduction histidine kinase